MVGRASAPQLQLPRESVYTLRADILRLAAVDRRLVDVRRVLSMLRTEPWQPAQLESNRHAPYGTPPTRLDACAVNLEIRGLAGVGNAGVNVANAYIDSPFWKAVQYAKGKLTLCLFCLQDDGVPDIANDPDSIFSAEGDQGIAGGDGQVLAVFPLITLIFATFDIPVPPAGSALWNTRTSAQNWANQANPHVSVFEMIDLESSPWYTAHAGNKDRHSLKPNLRQGVFRLQQVNGDPLLPYQAAALMPWADGTPDPGDALLPSLVGAVKALQAQYARPGAWDPLADVRTHCEAVLARLERERRQLRDSVQDQTVHAVPAPAPLTQLERDELLALARRPREGVRAMRALLPAGPFAR